MALNASRSDRKIMVNTDQVFLEMLNMLIDMTTQNLKKMERRKFETLITIHLHQRDIFHDLVRTYKLDVFVFLWGTIFATVISEIPGTKYAWVEI